MILQSLDRRWERQVLLTFDDGRELLLDQRTAEESRYRVGSELNEEELAALIESSTRRAREYALYLLGLRDYSEGELRRKLREKGYREVAEEIVTRMRELGFLNDEAYARRLARDCRVRRLYSRRRTMQDLCARGVKREIAEMAVDAVDESENLTDLQQALALLEKKRYNAPITEPVRRHGSQLLLRNGYDSSTVREAWRALEDAAKYGEEFLEAEG